MKEETLHLPFVTPDALEKIFTEEVVKNARGQMQRYQRLMAYYRCAMMEIETKLNVLNEEFSLRHDRNPISDVKSRLKHPESIREKLLRRGASLTIDSLEAELSDVASVRVICSFTADVYTIAEALLSQDDITLIERKDYIEEPSYNGYRSLHLDFRVPIYLSDQKLYATAEIQIRTVAMDFWASLEHELRYKSSKNIPKNIANEMLRCADDIALIDGKMQAIYKAIRDSK